MKKRVDLDRGVAQVEPGADAPYVRDFYKRRETLEDFKKVDARFKAREEMRAAVVERQKESDTAQPTATNDGEFHVFAHSLDKS